MVAKKRIGKWVWVFIIAGLVIQFLFDPISNIINLSENVEARLRLPGSRARWDAQNIRDYSFELRAYQEVCWVIYGRIEVRQGRVNQVNYMDFETGDVSAESMPPSRWNQNPDRSDSFLCNYANFTMPQLFDLTEQLSERIYRISFDSRYGFISKVQFAYPKPNGLGLFSSRIGGCCTGFAVENFQVLDK